VKKVWISSIFSLGLHRHLKPLGIWRNNEEWVQEEVPSEDGDDEYEFILKIRGITLNADVMAKGLRYETFKEKVVQFVKTGTVPPIKVEYPYFLRPSVKDGVVFSKSMSKGYKPFVAKGIVRPNYDVLDFGYTPI
jgi:hypothetical protein